MTAKSARYVIVIDPQYGDEIEPLFKQMIKAGLIYQWQGLNSDMYEGTAFLVTTYKPENFEAFARQEFNGFSHIVTYFQRQDGTTEKLPPIEKSTEKPEIRKRGLVEKLLCSGKIKRASELIPTKKL